MLHVVIIAPNKPAHEALRLWTFPLRLCYNIRDSSHYVCISGAFRTPSGTGEQPFLCCCLRGQLSGVMEWRSRGNPPNCRHAICLRGATSMFPCAWQGSGRRCFSSFRGSFSIYTSSFCEKASCWRWEMSHMQLTHKHSI